MGITRRVDLISEFVLTREIRVNYFGAVEDKVGDEVVRLGCLFPLRSSWFQSGLGQVLGLICLLAPFVISVSARAERSANWHMFKARDGLRENSSASISISPHGTVWVKHGEAPEISSYDGYQIHNYPSPGRDNFRVYESRTGQLWSLYPAGLVVSPLDNRWTRHPIAEIRAEIPLRQVRQIPLLPADRDHVLVLLFDKLMQYDSSARKATVIKLASELHLGKFQEMTEAHNGDLWVSGTRGLAKFPGPIRHLRPGIPAQEFLLDPSVGVESLQKPFEDSLGGITAAASEAQSGSKKVIVHFDGTNWSMRPTESGVRQAWPAWDHTTWAQTFSYLYRFDPSPLTNVVREKIWVGRYNDVATDRNDVFWLATSEGLLRYAPYPWRAPVQVEDVNSHVHAIVADSKERLWFASTDYLIRFQEGTWKFIKWPEGSEAAFESNDSLFSLPNGRLVFSAGEHVFLFDPDSEHFSSLNHPEGKRFRLVGHLLDGALAVQILPREPAKAVGFELDRYDGNSFEGLLRAGSEWVFGGDVLFLFSQRSNGDLWIGGRGGVARYRNKKLELFGPPQGFRLSRPVCMAEIGGGKLWCGGSDRLLEFNGKTWSLVRGGLDRVNRIATGRDEKIWLATPQGIVAFVNGSWMSHGMEEGLPSPGISDVCVDRHGQIWAGTTRGLSLFHPDADVSPPKTLPPQLELAKGQSTGDTVTFFLNGVDKWEQTPADRLLFSTRLDEGQWSPFTNSMVKTFQKLGPGKHHLEVHSMDRNWNEDLNSTAAADFEVVLAWYKDPRLILIGVSGTVLVLFFAGLAVNRHLQLIRSYAEVERIVTLRTRELEQANEQLLQSQKMKALGTLAAGIAHDFNNILSIIRGSAQIIQNNLEDRQKILTRLSRIQAVVEQGSGIVKSMLGLSRGRDKDLVELDLNEVVEEIVKLIGDRFLHGITFQFQLTPALPKVLLSKELLQQMLLNLILNAADAMDHHGRITLQTGQMQQLPMELALSPRKAAGYDYVSVHDTGCGIAPEILPRIFEPFFTTKALSVRRGTGLGLSMVYELAREMGFGLEVSSTVGQGSTFTILLPLKDSSASVP